MRYSRVIYHNGVVGISENKVGLQRGLGALEGHTVSLGDPTLKVTELLKVICLTQTHSHQSVKAHILLAHLRIKVNR